MLGIVERHGPRRGAGTGSLAEVGATVHRVHAPHAAVVITQIEGREFFDALIQLDDISAIEVRARGER